MWVIKLTKIHFSDTERDSRGPMQSRPCLWVKTALPAPLPKGVTFHCYSYVLIPLSKLSRFGNLRFNDDSDIFAVQQSHFNAVINLHLKISCWASTNRKEFPEFFPVYTFHLSNCCVRHDTCFKDNWYKYRFLCLD